MEKVINLPNVDAITEFVNKARETGDTVLVSKEGYNYQIDGASILGMMAVIGANIRVKCLGNSESFTKLFERYAIAK